MHATMSDKYVWLLWASSFLIPWMILWLWFPQYRKLIAWASALTAPFGLTEPLFVPRYWNPPSLFYLAQRTGFDIESLIFSFAIGGIGVVLYDVVTRRRPARTGRGAFHGERHRYHGVALVTPVIVFPALCLLPWNPIYAAIVAMFLGGIATVACRPDLGPNTTIGGGLFAVYYLIFMLGLERSAPGYIGRVWNLSDLSGVVIYGIPLEEILFGFTFGIYWSGIYEHLTWRGSVSEARERRRTTAGRV
jgi:hypothetical protein